MAQANQSIRKATFEDLPQLVEICNKSFPSNLRWTSKRSLARGWWKVALTDSAAEVWVFAENNTIKGFCVLIIDEPKWNKQRRIRRGSLFLVGLSMILHPIIAFHFVLGVLTKNRRINSFSSVSNRNLPPGWGPHWRTWLELIAVKPEQRGKGVAGKLIDKCCQRTIDLKRHAVALRVKADNLPAIRLYEKQGFVCYQANQKGMLFFKEVLS